MSDELELVGDGNGFAVIGPSSEVERFFVSSGLAQVPSRKLDIQRLHAATQAGGAAAQAGASVAENSGRWVKLTEESARYLRNSPLMKGSTEGTARAIAMDSSKKTQHILQIVTKPGTALTNPAVLGGVGGLMTQLAMQQQMDEISDYLQEIDAKVDDILRAQKDAVLADMIGVDLIVEDALTIRDEVGRVSDITWSKVQATSQTIARTQGYALRQLDGIAEKLRNTPDVPGLAKATHEAEPKVREWLAILARTFQLQDGISVLELDRVLDASPDELESHRRGLLKVRENRVQRIGGSTAGLLAEMNETVNRANAGVLTNPFKSPATVATSKRTGAQVRTFRTRLGIDEDAESADARTWGRAAVETIEGARDAAADGANQVVRRGGEALADAGKALQEVDFTQAPEAARHAAEQAGAAVAGTAAHVAGAVGGLFRRRNGSEPSPSTAGIPAQASGGQSSDDTDRPPQESDRHE